MKHYAFLGIETLICMVLVFILLFYYARRKTNPLVLVTAYITWFLNFILVFFLPFDIYLTKKKEENNKFEGDDATLESILINGYKIIYWSLFFLSWLFVPLLQEYENSGEFTKTGKLCYSIKSNLLFYGICGAVCIIFFVLTKCFVKKDEFDSFLSNIMNCSYLAGLFTYFLLLGYSLVKVPVDAFEKAQYLKRVRYLEWRAKCLLEGLKKIQNKLVEEGNLLYTTVEDFYVRKSVNKSRSSEENLEDINDFDADIHNTKSLMNCVAIMKERYEYLYQNKEIFGIDLKKNSLDFDVESLKNVKELIKLNGNINKNEWNDLRIQCRLRAQYKNWVILNTVLWEKYNLGDDENNNNNNITLLSGYNYDKDFIPYADMTILKSFYYRKIRKVLLLINFVILIIVALMTLLSEISNIFYHSIYGMIFDKISENNEENIIMIHFLTLIPILFLFVMSIHTLFKMKISGFLYMCGHRQTDSVSLMYFCSNLCRFSFSVCLNFCQNISNCIDKNTYIEEYLNISMKNIGSNEEFYYYYHISRFAPVFLFLFVVLIALKIPERLGEKCGFRIFKSYGEQVEEEIKEGHDYYMEINKKLNGEMILVEDNLKLPEDKYNK